MKNNLTIILLTVSFCCLKLISCKNSYDCSKVKNGNFFYTSKIGRHKVEVLRFDSVQIEKDLTTGLILKSKVLWESDCQFKLFVNSLSESKLDSIDQIISQIPVNIQIVFVDKDFYISKGIAIVTNEKIEVIDTIYLRKK